jgi:hypothetical protein
MSTRLGRAMPEGRLVTLLTIYVIGMGSSKLSINPEENSCSGNKYGPIN